MKFSSEFIEKVLSANNIIELISQYTNLKTTGRGFMGRCPFPDHQERTASFSVSEEKQVYNCFGCHRSGNMFTFLRDYSGMAFPEAVEFLANRAHIPMPTQDAAPDPNFQKKKSIIQLNNEVARFFVTQLEKAAPDSPVKAYVEKRGITKEMQGHFLIGYSAAGWDSLVKWLQARDISLALAESARLVKKRDDGSGYYDVFRDRLMFPIRNPMGEVVGFGGRIIQQGEPKYLNSPESEVFLKSKILYGADINSKHIRAEDSLILCEGYMDVLGLWKYGFKNAVASMGTSFTPDHGKLMSKWTKNVVVLFDGDQAGLDAAERSLPILLKAGLFPRAVFLPNDMDPDDYLKIHGADNLRTLIKDSVDLFRLLLNGWMVGYRGEPFQKVQLIDRVRPILDLMADERLRKLYIEMIKDRLGVSAQWIAEALGGKARPPQVVRPQPESLQASSSNIASDKAELTETAAPAILLKGASRAELVLLSLAIKNRANMALVLASEVERELQSMGVRQVLDIGTQVYRQVPEKFDSLAAQLAHEVDTPEVLIGRMLQADLLKDQTAEQALLKDCILKIKEQALKLKLNSLMAEVKLHPTPEKLSEIQELNKRRLELGKVKDVKELSESNDEESGTN